MEASHETGRIGGLSFGISLKRKLGFENFIVSRWSIGICKRIYLYRHVGRSTRKLRMLVGRGECVYFEIVHAS